MLCQTCWNEIQVGLIRSRRKKLALIRWSKLISQLTFERAGSWSSVRVVPLSFSKPSSSTIMQPATHICWLLKQRGSPWGMGRVDRGIADNQGTWNLPYPRVEISSRSYLAPRQKSVGSDRLSLGLVGPKVRTSGANQKKKKGKDSIFPAHLSSGEADGLWELRSEILCRWWNCNGPSP